MDIYVVKSGDTLYALARRFGVTAEELTQINQLQNPDLLSVGQALLLPVGSGLHTVRRGDTLYAVARRYGIPLSCLIAANPQITNPDLIRVGQQLRIPKGGCPQREILVNGYISRSSEAALRASLPCLSYLSPFSWRVDAAGELTRDFDVDLRLSAAYGAANLLTITNLRPGGGFSSDTAHALLNDEAAQDRLIDHLERLLSEGGYYGVGVDFEYVYAFDREAYNRFLRRLTDRMHCLGHPVVTALAPKVSDEQQGLLYTAHDYAFHGAAADQVVLMTYEWGYSYGPPMAVAPLNKVRQVLDYAVRVMPAGKLLLGIPNYGYNWTLPFTQGTAAQVLSCTAAVTLAGQARAAIRFDPEAQSPFFHYTDSSGRRHEVWFEDARSLRAKYELVREYGLGGISIWNLNTLYRSAFLLLESMYGVEKLL